MNAPEIGQLVTIRDRQWVVADVSRGSQETDVLSGNEPVVEHLVSLVSVEDDAIGDEAQVIWELEPGRAIVDYAALPTPDPERFDEPDRLDAFLDAIRWGAIATADPRYLQSPFRSGITIEDYQLDPVVRALRMPRVNLLIADDTGVGKTIEAGLVVQVVRRGRCPRGSWDRSRHRAPPSGRAIRAHAHRRRCYYRSWLSARRRAEAFWRDCRRPGRRRRVRCARRRASPQRCRPPRQLGRPIAQSQRPDRWDRVRNRTRDRLRARDPDRHYATPDPRWRLRGRATVRDRVVEADVKGLQEAWPLGVSALALLTTLRACGAEKGLGVRLRQRDDSELPGVRMGGRAPSAGCRKRTSAAATMTVRVPREMTWITDGRGYTTGAAGSRCYDDLVRQRGEAAADKVRDDSVKKMEHVRVLFPVGRGQQKFDVTVEAFLLAAGVPENEVERLAGRYRKGSGASVDLTPYA